MLLPQPVSPLITTTCNIQCLFIINLVIYFSAVLYVDVKGGFTLNLNEDGDKQSSSLYEKCKDSIRSKKKLLAVYAFI